MTSTCADVECRVCRVIKCHNEFGRYYIRGIERRRRICNLCRRKEEAKRYAEDPDAKARMKLAATRSHAYPVNTQ